MRRVIALALALGRSARWRPARSPRRLLTVDDLSTSGRCATPSARRTASGSPTPSPARFADTDKNDTDVWMVSWDGTQQIQVDLDARRRVAAPLEPGRQVSRVPLVAPGREGTRRSGCSTAPAAKRSSSPTSRAASPTTPGRPTARGSCSSSRIPIPRDPQEDKEPAKAETPKTPKPIVIDRYHFKADVDGYLRGERTHLYLFDVATKKAEALTPGAFDEESPAWSPDGRADRLHPPARRRRRRQGAEPRPLRRSRRAPARSRRA